MHPGAELAGKLEVVDIGFPEQVVDCTKRQGKLDNSSTRDHNGYHLRPLFSHKGSYGRVLVVAGSTGMTGAAALASEAALRAGAGLVSLATPKHLNPILEGLLPEVMTLPLTRNGHRELGSLHDLNHPRICGKNQINTCNRSRAFPTPRNSITRPSINT